MLKVLELDNIRLAFNKVINLFPDFTVFSNDDKSYCDIFNFIINDRLKVSDDRLNNIAPSERTKLCNEYQKSINILEDISTPFWGYNADSDGWDSVLNYIAKHR